MGSDRSRGWLLVGAQMLLLVVLIVAPAGEAWPVSRSIRVMSLVLRAGGLVAIAVAAINLGRSLSVHPEPPSQAELKTDGLYRWVRHPIYSGVLLLAAGIALTSGNPVPVVSFVLLIFVLLSKARLEERMLRERFTGYDEYARRTPAFVPKPGSLFF